MYQQQRPLEEAVIAAVDVERVLAAGLAAIDNNFNRLLFILRLQGYKIADMHREFAFDVTDKALEHRLRRARQQFINATFKQGAFLPQEHNQ